MPNKYLIITPQIIFTGSDFVLDWQNRLTNNGSLESDCQFSPATLLESDCACAAPAHTLFETNCACAAPSPAPTLSPVAITGETVVQWAGYSRFLADDYHLCFDIQGQNGIAVVNDATYQLLQSFRNPQSVATGLKFVPQMTDAQIAVEYLVQTGLLKPTATTTKKPQSAINSLTAWIHVTNDCNLRCPYCYVDKTPDKMALEQGYQAVEAVFRSAIKQKFTRVKLKYAGGEATLNFSAVLALHRHAQQLARQHNLELDGVVLSNGVAISDRMIIAMKEMKLRLMVSLDGVGQYHDGQRPFVNGRGSFAHLERTLERLARHHLTPSISITISQQNVDGLAEVVAYVLERKLPFTLNFFRDNEACGIAAPQLRYEEDQLIEAMLAAFKVIEANLPSYSLLGNLLDLARLDSAHEYTCGVGHSYMVINHQGGVAKCHMALDQTVATVTDDDPLRLIQLDQIGILNLPVSQKEGCRTCDWQNWCAGGCPALTYRVTGRYDLKSPNCRIYKALFPEVLRLEGLRLLKYSGFLPA